MQRRPPPVGAVSRPRGKPEKMSAMVDSRHHVLVIGASLSGLFATAAASAAGARVTVLERDTLPEAPTTRKGVPQGGQAHALLHRGLLAAERMLPGLRDELLRHGAVALNTGAIPWLTEHGWQPTWIPSYEIVSATRP